MTDGQKELLNGFENVYSMSEVAGFQIPDPYGGTLSEYIDVRDEIARAIPYIVKYLEHELKKNS